MIDGRYFNGEVAEAQFVRADFGSGTLRLYVRDGTNCDGVLVAQYERKNFAVSRARENEFMIRFKSGGYLRCESTIAENFFREHHLLSTRPSILPLRWSFLSLGVTALLGVSLLATLVWALPQLGVLFVPLIPLTYEERLGKQMMDHVSKEMGGKCDDSQAQAAMSRFVTDLLRASDISRPVSATFLNSEVINAFAAPGGNIVVLRGIIEVSESGDELGGVIAHELGHVLNRHAMQGVVKRFGLGIVSSYLGASLDTPGNISLLASVTMFDMSYSRDHEREADFAGGELLRKAGVNSRGMATLFARLKEKKGDHTGISALLATHPSLEERIRNLSLIGREGRPAFSEEEWRIIKKSCG